MSMNERERMLRDAMVSVASHLGPGCRGFDEINAALAAADAIPDAPVLQVPDGPEWDSVRKNASETDAWPDWKRVGSGLQMGQRKKPDAPVVRHCTVVPTRRCFCTDEGACVNVAPMTTERRAELVEVMCESFYPALWHALSSQAGEDERMRFSLTLDALIKAGVRF